MQAWMKLVKDTCAHLHAHNVVRFLFDGLNILFLIYINIKSRINISYIIYHVLCLLYMYFGQNLSAFIILYHINFEICVFKCRVGNPSMFI